VKFEIGDPLSDDQSPCLGPDFARWRSADGDVLTTFHRTSDGYLVRFKERADFAVSLSRRVVTCRPARNVSRLTAEDLYLNQILPMISGQRGETVLHASAVAVKGEAVAFVGQTGRGKSTLAAAFAHAGMPFLSDDGVRLTKEGGRYLAAPNQPSFRLWQDSEAAVVSAGKVSDDSDNVKTRVAASDALPFESRPLPLRALYFLGPGHAKDTGIESLPEQAALAELLNHSFLLDVTDKARLQSHFGALADLSATVPVFSLDYPRQYDRLGAVLAAIVQHSPQRDLVQ